MRDLYNKQKWFAQNLKVWLFPAPACPQGLGLDVPVKVLGGRNPGHFESSWRECILVICTLGMWCVLSYAACMLSFVWEEGETKCSWKILAYRESPFDKLKDDVFQNLFCIKVYAYKTNLLAMKLDFGKTKLGLRTSHCCFEHRLISICSFQSQGWTMIQF